jgi:hypothetical protein
VFEALGRGFTLLAFDAEDGAVRAFEDASTSVGAPLKVVRDSYGDDRLAYEARLVLVRPDQHVVWAGDHTPPDALAVMRTATGTA